MNMEEKPGKPRCIPPALVVAGLLLALAVAYIAGYFAISEVVPGGLRRGRMFHAEWECTVFCPAVRIEAAARGEVLLLCYSDRNGVRHVYDFEPH